MSSRAIYSLFNKVNRLTGSQRSVLLTTVRPATTTSTGSILPMPQITRFGLLGLVCAVVPGLLIGATISKKIANFLEENELFVPSDDDDDDD